MYFTTPSFIEFDQAEFFARFLNGTEFSDKINTKVLLTNINMLSANQVDAQIKLTEVWKSINL